MKYLIITLLFTLQWSTLLSQNTIGTTLNTPSSANGYTLITPNSNVIPSLTYLIDNCGNVVNSWSSEFKGQGSDLILNDGSLYRASFDDQSTLDYAGNNGRLEHFDWDGNLIWGLTLSDTDFSFHHDYLILDNGNILLLVAQRMTEQEALQAGRNPANLVQNELYTEKIIEIEPIGLDQFNLVWEWNVWNHLVQEFDSEKDNFGDVLEHPELIDINFIGFSNDNADWLHLNSIDYNPQLDQILISSRFTSEIYVIDHSTTTEEAASHTGGTSGKGGDILYRWGNPAAYKRGSSESQTLFGQHTAHWIPQDLPNGGQIMVFNNGFMRGYSTIDIISVPETDENGNYPILTTGPYNPSNSTIIYQADPLESFFAPFLSSAYTLENGNILINNGPVGQLSEINPDNQETVWEYISPVTITEGTLSQGDQPPGILSRFFRASRYSIDFPGFEGRDLTAGTPIELNPIPENCDLFLSLNQTSSPSIKIYPNPTKEILNISAETENLLCTIYDFQGKSLYTSSQKSINVSSLPNGIYFITIQTKIGSKTETFIKN